MTLTRTIFTAFLLLMPRVAFAQSANDEARIIEAALKNHFEVTLPYIEHWVVSSSTESLQPATPGSAFDAARTDYIERNSRSVSLEDIALPPGATLGDLSPFSHAGTFDWAAFHRQYPEDDTFTARIARPAFSDESHAAVRVDVWSSVKRGRLTASIFLEKSDGRWQVIGGEEPAVR
ncbi:MAG TPA: hypothetical protein VHL58_03810 [Thermoanaerobaculia bacterium]|nr:hypothetical protein [Thermoanaerobaculia bacterium]